MRRLTYLTKNENRQAIVKDYRAAGNEWPATPKAIAVWAIDQGLWAPHPAAVIGQCAEELAQAMREEYITDPQGRRVRAKHAARLETGQTPLWDDIRTAPPAFMQMAFQQRRHQIVGDCRQLKVDVDSFNENGRPQSPIQISFDFTLDLVELELAG